MFKALRLRKRSVLGFTFTVALLFLFLNSAKNRLEPVTPLEGDFLVYSISNYSGESQLILYDPAEGTHTPILLDWDIHDISMRNDRLAISSSHEGGNAIYILDYPFTGEAPTLITNDKFAQYYRMAWSLDGRYLAYVTTKDDEANLFIWDGKSSAQIANSPAGIGDMAWGPGSQLAFVIFYTNVFPYEGDSSEAFIWNGQTTVNLSQNPTGTDRVPAWNVDGRLAFLSERNETYDIFVWDGISTIDGKPDVSTFDNIAPHLTDYFSNPTWTNSGSLAFEGSGPIDSGFAQIYEWNGTNVTNISQNPTFHNGGQRWRSNGSWSFNTYFSGEQLVYIRDETNETQLTLEGYGARWSTSGYFSFCQRTVTGAHWRFQKWELPELVKDHRGWTLLLGDGDEIVDIAHGDKIDMVWTNGEVFHCLDG